MPRMMCLGAKAGEVAVHSFCGETDGHSSVSTLGRRHFEKILAPVTTLDQYWISLGRPRFSFVKCDVEGSELAVLQGAQELLRSDSPPMWLLEVNDETSRAFGYMPSEMIEYLAELGYSFLIIRPGSRHPLVGVPPLHGDTMLAYQPRLHHHRIRNLR
jgi:hypothetical protein